MALGSYRTGSGKSISALVMQYGDKAFVAMGKQLYLEGSGILAQSQPLVPVDTGALKASGYVTEPQNHGGEIVVTIGYGGVAGAAQDHSAAAAIYQGAVAAVNRVARDPAGYALYVHENLEAHHPVGQSHYLSVPFNQARAGMTNRIVEGMNADLRGRAAPDFTKRAGPVVTLSPEGMLPGAFG